MTPDISSKSPHATGHVNEPYTLSDLISLEAALANGLHAEWRRLISADPQASVFQSPGWCMPWYRCYESSHHPHVIVVAGPAGIVGLVPMAVDRQSNELVFASDSMADYRDIVALPGHRAEVVQTLLSSYLSGRFSQPLQVGWLDPASDTVVHLTDACRTRGLGFVVRHQPCWRWFPPAPARPSAQKFLNWYKRHGEVEFEVVDSDGAWQRFRDEYYRQHSLRQLQSGRAIAFADPRRRALYDQLFSSAELETHVTSLRWNGQLLAGHFGYVWKGVLLLGPPSIRIEEDQRSPAVILFAWIIQNASELGLLGFDLTIGDSDFKKRLGNRCVELTTVAVFGSKSEYYVRSTLATFVVGIKSLTTRHFGADSWQIKVKPAAGWVAYKRRRIAELGIFTAARTGASALARAISDRRTGLVFSMTPVQLQEVAPKLEAFDSFEVHANQPEDLLLWQGSSPSTASAISACAKNYARIRASGRTLHTLVFNGALAGWGYSYVPFEQALLTETPGAVLAFLPNSVSLYDFHVIPEFRGRRLYQVLLTRILADRFSDGVARAYITVLESNKASRAAIERIGFTLLTRNRYWRVMKWRSLRSSDAEGLTGG